VGDREDILPYLRSIEQREFIEALDNREFARQVETARTPTLQNRLTRDSFVATVTQDP
jgi:hypothetical protein